MSEYIRLTRAVRNRVIHAISPQTAEAVGMSFTELQMFVCGSHYPPQAQLLALAAFLKMKEEVLR